MPNETRTVRKGKSKAAAPATAAAQAETPLDEIDIEKIAQRRKDLGLTQEAAAIKAGLTNRQFWNNVEKGKRKNVTIETLGRIARAIGLRAKDLLK